MISQETFSQLYDMHLSALARDIKERHTQPSFIELGFDEQLSLLIDKEWHRRRERRTADLIKAANFCYNNASVQELDYSVERGLTKKQINEFAECSYITSGHNIIIMGATGVGKSYLACALGISACRSRYTCRYVRTPNLLDELAIAKISGSTRQIIRQYAKPKLLILDEWLLTQVSSQGLEDIFEIIDCRSVEKSSTIFCSQIDVSEWLQMLGDSLIGEGLLDRVIHISHNLVLNGDSMRKKNGLKQSS